MDPLVSLMMVEKVPDSTYEMVGGLDKQIKEIKEVCPFPILVYYPSMCLAVHVCNIQFCQQVISCTIVLLGA